MESMTFTQIYLLTDMQEGGSCARRRSRTATIRWRWVRELIARNDRFDGCSFFFCAVLALLCCCEMITRGGRTARTDNTCDCRAGGRLGTDVGERCCGPLENGPRDKRAAHTYTINRSLSQTISPCLCVSVRLSVRVN